MRSLLLKMEGEVGVDGGLMEDFFGALPEGFVAKALSLTSPGDACRLSLVCSVFRSAAEWDAVWESFMPSDYQKIVTEAEDGGCSLSFSSKKQLYLRLCDRPLIIDGGNKSFWLDKQSGKKCYMLAARDLSIVWGDTPLYWRWISIPESRFSEVAELIRVCWFEIHGRISTLMLSPNTAYVAFIVFKWTPETYGFGYHPAEVSIGISGLESQTQTAFLVPEAEQVNLIGPIHPPSNGNAPKQRQDGWLEIELGEYFIKEGEVGELEMRIIDVKGGNWKGGLVIQGIEIRPKASKK